jgi:agmatinase
MVDLSKFDIEAVSNPNNNIFGFPFSEEEARVVILPVPWEATVGHSSGTARAADHVFREALRINLYDPEAPDAWKQGFYMRPVDKKLLMKSDFLRKEAELYIDYISKGAEVESNRFMCKSLRDINEGSEYMNRWVYEQTASLLGKGKLVGLLGGDHSIALGYLKALGEVHESFGILQIDAHCDLREAYEAFPYSHASIMYNVMQQVPAVTKLVQLGVRDYGKVEYDMICDSNGRITTYFDKDIKDRIYDGETWKQVCDDIVAQLPDKVYISFDIDGLDPKLCPNTHSPVQGGLDTDQVNYLFRKILQSGRKLIGFDLNEIGTGENCMDANVGARELFKLCNLMVYCNGC